MPREGALYRADVANEAMLKSSALRGHGPAYREGLRNPSCSLRRGLRLSRPRTPTYAGNHAGALAPFDGSAMVQ